MELITDNWQVLPAVNSGNENAIFFTISDNYAFAVANMLMGLNKYSAETMKNTDIIVYHNGISEENAERLRALHENTYFIPMQFPAQWLQIADHPKTMRWGYFIVCKFFGYELIKRYKTAIFMDADMLIRGDISELFQISEDIAWRRILAWDVNEVFADLIAPGTQMLCGNSGLLIFTDRLQKYNIDVDAVTSAFDKIKDFVEGGIDETVIALLAYEKGMSVKELDVEIYNTSAVYLCQETKIVHFLDARGVITKPWVSLAAYLYYEDWVANHQKWLEMGGEDCIHFTKDDYYKLFAYDHVTEIRKLKKQKKKLKLENSELSADVNQLTLANTKFSNEIDKLEKLKNELIHEKSELDAKNATLSIKIDTQMKQNTALSEKNAKLVQKIERLNDELSESSANNDLLSKKNLKLHNENKKQFAELEKRIEKITALKEEIREKNRQIGKLNKQLTTMLNSKSWKLTKPLRWFAKFIKKLLHR